MFKSVSWSALRLLVLLLTVVFASTGCNNNAPDRIELVPYAHSMKVDTVQPYYAVGIYPDGSKLDLTDEVKWKTGDKSAEVSDTGFVTTVEVGDTEIIAKYKGVKGRVPLRVHDEITVGLSIYPAHLDLVLGEAVEVRAVAFYDDGTQQNVVFSVQGSLEDDSGILAYVGDDVVGTSSLVFESVGALFSQHALLKGVAVGSDTLVVSFDGVTARAEVTVTDALVLEQIVVEPIDLSAVVGTEQAYVAFGFFDDGSSRNLTQSVLWSTTNLDTATISNDVGDKGLLSAVAPGDAQILASFDGVEGVADLIVKANVELMSIELNPISSQIRAGEFERFTALAHFSDNTVVDVTALATWSSSDPTVAVIGNTQEYVGLAVGLAEGDADIVAWFDGLESQAATLTVHPPVVVVESLDVSPGDSVTPLGTTVRYTAVAHYSDGSSADVTRDTAWASSDSSTVTILSGEENAGLAIALAEGSASLKGAYHGVAGSATLAVTSPVLDRIIVDPVVVSVPEGQRLNFRAVAIYTDLTHVDVTELVAWESTDRSVANVSNLGPSSGLVSTIQQGATQIVAGIKGVKGQADLIVTRAEVTRIQVTPVSASVPIGLRQPFQATAHFTNGDRLDVTGAVTWQSSTPKSLHISNYSGKQGWALALNEGDVVVTAFLGKMSGEAKAQVTPAILEELNIVPQRVTVPAGQAVAYQAEGIYSDGSDRDVTTSASWRSSDSAVAVIVGTGNTAGAVLTLAPGATAITALFDGVEATTALSVTDAVVVDVQVTPANLVEPAGTSGQMQALALMSDRTTVDMTDLATWTSSAPEVVTVVSGGGDAGHAYLLTAGTALVHAEVDGVGDEVTVQVTEAVLVEIQVTPLLTEAPRGVPVQYSAQGVFSDGSITPINEDVAWSSLNPAVAIMSEGGLASTLTEGVATIQASFLDVAGLAELLVTSPQVVELQIAPPIAEEPAGTTGYLAATAIYTDGSHADVTEVSAWQSSAPEIVTVGTTGEQAGYTALLVPGKATIGATYLGQSQSIDVTVTAAVLVEIVISPVLPSLAKGRSIDFSAQGIFSDGSSTGIDSDVHWFSSSTEVATIDVDGLATALVVGSTSISATHVDGLEVSTTLDVTAAELDAIELSPQSVSLPDGRQTPFTVTGVYSDASTAPLVDGLVWGTADSQIAVVDQGVVLAQGVGLTTVDVSLESTDLTDVADVEVTSAELESIVTSLDSAVLAKGTSTLATATGEYSDGGLLIITGQVTWTSDNTDVAVVSNAEGSIGEVSGVGVGETTVFATLDGVSDGISVSVTDPVLVSLSVEPFDLVIAQGLSQQYAAWGSYTDGTEQDLTSHVTWASSDVAVAEISFDGLAQSSSAGVTTIGADKDGVHGQTSLTINAAIPSAMDVYPVGAQVAQGTSVAYTAWLTVAGEVSEITDQVVWSSSDPLIASVSNAAGEHGVATAEFVAGFVDITGTYLHVPTQTEFVSTQTLEVLELPNKPGFYEILPETPTLQTGMSLQLSLWGVWNAGLPSEHRQDLTAQSSTSWQSLDTSLLAADNRANKGLVTAKQQPGEVDVTAKSKGDTTITTVTITE